MGFISKLQAAFNAFTDKVPAGQHEANPFFYSYSGINQPTMNLKVDPQKLRAFSEQAVVRHALEYIRNQVSRLDWDIKPLPNQKFTAAQKKKVDIAKNCFRTPNRDDNTMTLFAQLIEDMLVIGYGSLEIKEWKGNADQPYLFYPVDSASIEIYLGWDGSPTSRRYAQWGLRGERIDFNANEMMMLSYNPRTNTPFGIGPVESAFAEIQYLLDAKAFAGKTASTSTPKKLLFLGQEITDPQLKEFRLYWQDAVEGRGNMPIIGGTDDVKSIELGAANDQSLYLAWQQFLIAIIANAFGLDITKFGATMQLSRQTGEKQDEMSDEGAIKPVAFALEKYMTQLMGLFDLEGVAEFKFQWTQNMDDRKAIGAVHQLYGQLDVLTIDEMRAEVGLDPLVDPETGEAIGQYTVSVYRAKYGTPPPIAPTDDSSDADAAKGQVNGDTNKTGNEETNNGVNGAKKIKEKSSLSKAHSQGLNE